MRLPEQVLNDAAEGLAMQLGLDFRGTQAGRLEQALEAVLRTSSVPASAAESYLKRLWSAPENPELMHVAGHFTVGETFFFRDTEWFQALEQFVLPQLITANRQRFEQRLRIWSAGCSTGEEPYSLAIVLDRLLAGVRDIRVEIVGSDIDLAALEKARRGIYRGWSLRAVPPGIRDQYFRRVGVDAYEIRPAIRRMVTFTPDNLVGETAPPAVPGSVDLVVCRHVLMYFTPDMARRAIARLKGAIAEGGWLATSPVEASAEAFRPLLPVNLPGTILFRKGPAAMPSPMLPAPTPPPLADSQGPQPSMDTSSVRTIEPLASARNLADQGHLSEARRECELALAKDPLDADANMLLAVICQEQEDLRTAFEAVRRVLYLTPNSALANFLMGSLLFRQGEQTQGKRYVEIAEHLLSMHSGAEEAL